MSKYLDKNGLVTVFNIVSEKDSQLEDLIKEITERLNKLEEVVKQYHPENSVGTPGGDRDDEDDI